MDQELPLYLNWSCVHSFSCLSVNCMYETIPIVLVRSVVDLQYHLVLHSFVLERSLRSFVNFEVVHANSVEAKLNHVGLLVENLYSSLLWLLWMSPMNLPCS